MTIIIKNLAHISSLLLLPFSPDEVDLGMQVGLNLASAMRLRFSFLYPGHAVH